MKLVVTFRDASLTAYAQRLQALTDGGGRAALVAALNAGGHAIRDKTVAAETAQTGLKPETIDRAQSATEATVGSPLFTISSKGGNVRAKYLGAAEGGGGVTAHPWNTSTFYRGAFITSGRPGQRRASPKLHGHVFENIEGRKWRGKIRSVRTGLFIPTEMITGRTRRTFDAEAGRLLATTIVARLGSLL